MKSHHIEHPVPEQLTVVAEKPSLVWLFDNEFLSDCIIESGKKSFKCHRNILAAASKFFKKYFEEHPLSAGEKAVRVKIPDSVLYSEEELSQDPLEAVLRFFYSLDDFEGLKKLGLNGLTALDFYSLFHLFECEYALHLLNNYIHPDIPDQRNPVKLVFHAIKLNAPSLEVSAVTNLAKKLAAVLHTEKQYKALLSLPFDVMKQLLERDDLYVEDERKMIEIVTEYIKMRDELPETTQEIRNPAQNIPEKPELKLIQNSVTPKGKDRHVKFAEVEKDTSLGSPKQLDESQSIQDERSPDNMSTPKNDFTADEILEQDATPISKDQAEDKTEEKVEDKAEEKIEEKVEEKPNEEKKVEEVPVKPQEKLPTVSEEENAIQKRLAIVKLSDDQKRELIKLIRLPFVSHDQLINASKSPIFSPFKDIFMEALSAKLADYEGINGKYHPVQEVKPRLSYESRIRRQKQEMLSSLSNPSKYEQGKGHPMKNQVHNEHLHSEYPDRQPSSGRSDNMTGSYHPVYSSGQPQKPSMKHSGDYAMNQFDPREDMSNVHALNMTYPYQTAPTYTSHPTSLPLSQSMDPTRGGWSQESGQPVKKSNLKQNPHFPGKTPIEFKYEYDFDDNGALYWLGSFGKQKIWRNPYKLGQVKVFFSSLGKGALDDFVGRTCVNCRTLNEPNSYMGVDLGVGRYLVPTCYSIRNRNSNEHVMLNWVFEGSINGTEWYWIDKRIHLSHDERLNAFYAKEREELKTSGYTSTWGIDPQQITQIRSKIESPRQKLFPGFRFFRITQIGPNSGGSDNMALSGFELYGTAFGESWMF